MQLWTWRCKICGGCSRKPLNRSSAKRKGLIHMRSKHGKEIPEPILRKSR